MGSDKSTIPAIKYLQCPAAVTMHHLQKFLSSKFEIDLQRNFKIDIVYDKETLPDDFSLIDVGYCFKWQRVSYIFIPLNSITYTAPCIHICYDSNSDGSTKHNHPLQLFHLFFSPHSLFFSILIYYFQSRARRYLFKLIYYKFTPLCLSIRKKILIPKCIILLYSK